MSEPKPMPSYWALAEEVTHLHGHLDKLQAENVRLRECLQDFADAIANDDGFGVDQGWMLDRMHKLGIEVDG